MKIMLLASSQVSIPPEKGGAIEAIIYELAQYLQKTDEIYVVSRKASASKIKNYVVLPTTIRKNKFFSIASDMLFGFRCVRKIRKIKPDVVHMHTTFTAVPIALLKRFLPRNTKLVYTSHSPSWTVPDSEIGLANRVFNKKEAFVMRRSVITTAVAESLRQGIIIRKAVPAEKVITIENFTRNDIFSGKYGKSWKSKHGIKGPMILFVGKLTETKGIDYLLRSVKNVLESFPTARFVLVGALEHEQELKENPWKNIVREEGIEDNVLFTGSVPSDELPKIYAAADIFVLPSLREGMPLVVMEALATGLPIVATNVSGTKEVLNDKCAILIEPRNSSAVSDAVLKVLSDKKLSRRMSNEAKKLSKKFDKKYILKKYKDLYYSLGA